MPSILGADGAPFANEPEAKRPVVLAILSNGQCLLACAEGSRWYDPVLMMPTAGPQGLGFVPMSLLHACANQDWMEAPQRTQVLLITMELNPAMQREYLNWLSQKRMAKSGLVRAPAVPPMPDLTPAAQGGRR